MCLMIWWYWSLCCRHFTLGLQQEVSGCTPVWQLTKKWLCTFAVTILNSTIIVLVLRLRHSIQAALGREWAWTASKVTKIWSFSRACTRIRRLCPRCSRVRPVALCCMSSSFTLLTFPVTLQLFYQIQTWNRPVVVDLKLWQLHIKQMGPVRYLWLFRFPVMFSCLITESKRTEHLIVDVWF